MMLSHTLYVACSDSGQIARRAGVQPAAAWLCWTNHAAHLGEEPVHLGDCISTQV